MSDTPKTDALFAEVEARKCYFWLTYEREHSSPLVDSGMIWRCSCAAPANYAATGKTASEAIQNALKLASAIEADPAA